MIASLPSPSSGVIHIGPVALRAYGLCIALGAFAAIKFASARQDRRGGPPGLVESIAWWAVPAGLVGARLYHVVTDWNSAGFADDPARIVRIWEGGLGIWGGVALGGAVGCIIAAHRDASPLRLLDVAAPALPIAQAIGRFGNWFNQELFGRPTNLPWGLRIDLDKRPPGYERYATFHPTFLYEALWCLTVAGLLLAIEHRKRLKPGQLFALYVALYTAGRWAIETVRIDYATRVGGFRVNEVVAPTVGVAAVLASVALGWRHVQARTGPELTADAQAVASTNLQASAVDRQPDDAERDTDSGGGTASSVDTGPDGDPRAPSGTSPPP